MVNNIVNHTKTVEFFFPVIYECWPNGFLQATSRIQAGGIFNMNFIKEAKYWGLHLQRIITIVYEIFNKMGTTSLIYASHLDNPFPVGH